ncbi:MAG: Gfo/Idh/MocA family oxidoreductase [Melioribacteraceae bacterium]|nr:Gfo/Idh/MocA family oxidoreductase [Melioribacteraceae bacterium]MCF8263492.1 Gfo/Idh/MocA family oxidoreductase [Melioribacteraceae bacterium]MCF8296954.1 Gfo/Idh/MocA family oxidoreductase [Saprospiraceae bacterium]
MALRFGIIGFGKIGQLRKKIIEELELGKVLAISDPNYKQTHKDIFLTNNYHELLKQDIDAVIIATPNNITATAVIDALNSGKHVFSEKPPGRNLEEVIEIKKCSAKHPNLKLKFGFNHRAHYSVMEAKRIASSNRMGKLMWARAAYGKAGSLDFKEQWRSTKNIAGGGILLDQGIHMLDLLILFFGGFSEVKSFVDTTYWDIPLEDNAFAILKNSSDQYAVFHSSSTQWKHIFRLELFFSEGYMILNGLDTGSKSYGRESLIIGKRQFEDEVELLGNPSEEQIFFDDDRSWYFEMNDFSNAIINDKPIIKGSVDSAVDVMQLIDKIYSSDNSWVKRENEGEK